MKLSVIAVCAFVVAFVAISAVVDAVSVGDVMPSSIMKLAVRMKKSSTLFV